jgi:hypothetical protein
MENFMTKITGIIFMIVFAFIAVNAQTEDAKAQKAKEVLEKARRAVYNGFNPEKLTGFRLQREGTIHREISTILTKDTVSNGKVEDKKIESEILFSSPAQAKVENILYSPTDNPSENYIKAESIFNAKSSINKTNLYRDGRLVDLNLILSRIPKAFYEQVKEGLSNIKEIEKKSSENNSAWLDIFPILLANPWNDETQLKWIGKADYSGTKADVLEVILDKNETARFFFDEKTNLLLLITSSSISEKGINVEKKIFFSSYEKADGILVSKKVIIETISISPKAEIVVDNTSHKIESQKTREVQESILKEFKLNPALKSEIFDFQKK